MNALVKSEPKMMLLPYMADKYSLLPDEFAKTVRATCGLAAATPEQFAAFLIVAKEYSLNPLTKEIYAFPGRGGGIVPIVSIDGWVNLVNSHPQCDGFDFVAGYDANSALFSYTCTMHRKDRQHPTVVTEYLSECVRPTEPWKMQHRMLRHKALIQAARYAFGFAGTYDEDEGRVIAETDAPPRLAPPRNIKTIEHQPAPETGSHLTGDPVDDIPTGARDQGDRAAKTGSGRRSNLHRSNIRPGPAQTRRRNLFRMGRSIRRRYPERRGYLSRLQMDRCQPAAAQQAEER